MIEGTNLEKLQALRNNRIIEIVEKYAKLCKPASIKVLTDSDEDRAYVRKAALDLGEERELSTAGHTAHFDGILDQARDKEHTKILLPEGKKMGKRFNTIPKKEGLTEIEKLLDGAMSGKEMLVCFYCLGPNDSEFSIPALQITDSAYVAHSEAMLYRPGYEEIKRHKDFFYFVHSAGELDERHNSKHIDKRRVYIDLEGDFVLSVNNQYAGSSVGLKKLALRLAINKSNREDWLCEHMFVMGVRPEGKKRVTYFTGAFPSACGKTSTAMIPGQTIVGDDIAYLRPGNDGKPYAVNVEQGIFGIIKDVNQKDDPLINKALTSPHEVIFSNILIHDSDPYWLGMDQEIPEEGENYAGAWHKGDKDGAGNELLAAHKNARYTMRIEDLDNADPKWDDPAGVPVSGIIYGGRDSDTNPPVVESLSWAHGVFLGGALESETTAATLGKEGVRKHNPMANLDFLVVPLCTYIENHLKFGEALDTVPKVFTTNYFLMGQCGFLTGMMDKKVWILWMEGRIHGEFEALETPIGKIPKYGDLKELFRSVLDEEYSPEQYVQQFAIRTTKLLDRLDRIEAIVKDEGVPDQFMHHMEAQRVRLKQAQERFNKDLIDPFDFE